MAKKLKDMTEEQQIRHYEWFIEKIATKLWIDTSKKYSLMWVEVQIEKVLDNNIENLSVYRELEKEKNEYIKELFNEKDKTKRILGKLYWKKD